MQSEGPVEAVMKKLSVSKITNEHQPLHDSSISLTNDEKSNWDALRIYEQNAKTLGITLDGPKVEKKNSYINKKNELCIP